MIITRTPLRLSFFGGGTDYPDYYKRNGGSVIGTTIDKYVYVTLNKLSDFFEYKIRVGYSKSELVNFVEEIQHPSVKHCLLFNGIKGNLDIHIASDLPARTGLGSSSSFTVGFLHAINGLKGEIKDKLEIAKDAIHVEHNLIQENVGSQDQVHAAFGGFNRIDFQGNEFKVISLDISKKNKELIEKSLLLFYTGQTRLATEVLKEQIENTKTYRIDSNLQSMKDYVDEFSRIIKTQEGDKLIQNFGNMFNQNWIMKKKNSSAISNVLIDEIYKKALRAGAYGGKIAGAGGGGFLVFVADQCCHQAIREALADLLEVKFSFEDEGTKIIYDQ
jgi:D-glycero-alpha-D-manno-heptose-7-phosphate kinase